MRSRISGGISTLEGAGVCLIALSLLISAVGISDYIRISSSVADIARDGALAENLQPLTVTLNGEATWDASRLTESLPRMSARMRSSLESEFPSILHNAALFVIDTQVARVSVNEETGQFTSTSFPHDFREGSLQLPALTAENTSISRAIADLVSGQRGLHPIPSGTSGVNGTKQFLPWVGVVGVRICYSFEHSLTATVTTTLGFIREPILCDVITLPLRGEIA